MPVIERIFWWLTLICGVVLLPSWLHPKTVRTFVPGGGQEIQGWGWQNVASWTGGLVIILLLTGYALRPRVGSPALCALLAAGLFAATAAESARTWLDLRFEAQALALGGTSGYQLSPATGMDGTIQKALAGVACTLVLLGLWLRPGEEREMVRQQYPILLLAAMLALAPSSGQAKSPPAGAGIPLVLVSDVQTFPGARAGAVVAQDVDPSEYSVLSVHHHVYERVNDTWRLADEIPVS